MLPTSAIVRRAVLATITSVARTRGAIARRMPTRRGLPAQAAVIGAIVALAGTGSALAFQALPPGTQVNDDLAAGINKTISVNGEDPTNSDVVGGALTAGKPAVPWAVFRQQETNGSPPPHDQIFARSFANGTWLTRGNGTVGGRSSASPQFSGSLNFDQSQDGEAPAIDFAGIGRTVPWATWYEETTGTGFANNNVFASRFDNTGDANKGKWIFGGQSRGTGGGTVPVPSLNIHTDQNAENPSVAGGSAVDPTKPGPWVTWQETTESAGRRHGPDLRLPTDRTGSRELRRRDTGRRTKRRRSRPGHRRLLLPADRNRACGPCRRGPEPQRRPHAQRDRAGHSVHRRLRRGPLGGLV